MGTLVRITLDYACFGVVVDGMGLINDAAPIGRWMIGKNIRTVFKWAKGKGGSVEVFMPKFK